MSDGVPLIDPFIVLLLIWFIAFAGLSGWVARQRDRVMAIWMVFGALLGPIAILLLRIAPPGRCRTCRASVRGWLTTCEWCGNPVAGRRATVPAVVDGPGPAAKVALAAAPVARVAGPVAVAATPAVIPSAVRSGSRKAGPVDDETEARIRQRLTSMSRRRAILGRDADPGDASGNENAGTSSRRVVASGIYSTGTISLVAGSRYNLEVDDTVLRILGPTDLTADTIVVTQDLAGMEATGFDDRLVITFGGGGRHGMVLVFSDLQGASIPEVADAIVSAARSVRVAS